MSESQRDASTGGNDSSSRASGGAGKRDVGQALLAVVLVVGLLSAAAFVPSVAAPFGGDGSGSGGAPGEDGAGGQGESGTGGDGGGSADAPTADGTGGTGVGGGSGSLGALSPGDRTAVGGDLTGGSSGVLSNQSSQIHFVVDSNRAAYWRTGAYDRYTGRGWARGDVTAVDAPEVTTASRILTQDVRLHRGATGLPAAWRPTSVSFLGDAESRLEITERGSLQVSGGVPASTTYQVVSHRQTMDPSVLRSTGTDYPEALDAYTQLPERTPDRLERFTSRLTRPAEDPYETARMIELWLERNKTYSLNASHDPSRPVADQFVFEMERGYCEYFATSMTAMLRTQGIPARYVVGYAPGQRARNGSYVVRGRDAHAWVEVYFEDVGWVRFDPTPAASRRGQERAAMPANQTGRRPVVPGSPGEGPTGGGSDAEVPELPTGGGDGEGNESQRVRPWLPEPPYDVGLNETPIPGDDVTVTVTKGGDPVEGVVVTVDGDPVGRTDRNGNVTVTVPYVENLTVGARVPEGVEPGGDDQGTRAAVRNGEAGSVDRNGEAGGSDRSARPAVGGETSGSTLAMGIGLPVRRGEAAVASDSTSVRRGGATVGGSTPESPALGGLDADPAPGTDRSGLETSGTDRSGPETPDGDSERTYEVRTNVTLRAEGPFAPGRSPVLVATIDDVPVRNARVTFAGEGIGRTDDRGRIQVEIPESLRGSVVVGVQRGEVAVETTMELESLSLAVDADTVVPLPGQGATLTATVGDHPVEGVVVYVGGRRVGTTDENGQVRATLPVANDVPVRGEGPVLTERYTLSNLLVVAAALLAIPLGLLVAGLVVVGRRAPDVAASPGGPRARLQWLRAALVAGVARAQSGLGRGLQAIADRAVDAVVLAGRGLHAGARLAVAGVGQAKRLVVRLGDVLRTAGRRVRSVSITGLVVATFGGLRRAVVGVVVAVRRGGHRLLRALLPPYGRDAPEFDSSGGGGAQAGGESETWRDRSVRAIWERFVRTLRVTRPGTMTPGEIARQAVDRGYPSRPVERLTEAYREVEYGSREETASLRERAGNALGRIRDGDRSGGGAGQPRTDHEPSGTAAGRRPAGDGGQPIERDGDHPGGED